MTHMKVNKCFTGLVDIEFSYKSDMIFVYSNTEDPYFTSWQWKVCTKALAYRMCLKPYGLNLQGHLDSNQALHSVVQSEGGSQEQIVMAFVIIVISLNFKALASY